MVIFDSETLLNQVKSFLEDCENLDVAAWHFSACAIQDGDPDAFRAVCMGAGDDFQLLLLGAEAYSNAIRKLQEKGYTDDEIQRMINRASGLSHAARETDKTKELEEDLGYDY